MKKSYRLYKCLQISLIIICLSITSSINAQCDFYEDINATVSAFEVTNTQQYVLVDDNGGTPGNINQIGTSATFSSVAVGSYWLYAVNYEGPQPSEIATGSAWSAVEAFDANTANCFEISAAYLNRAITVCAVIEVCEPADISVSTSNETTTAGYSQTFVLVDNTNQILESNTTGVFPVGDYVSDGDFFVYAVNTNETLVSTEINDKGTWADLDAMKQAGLLCMEINERAVRVIDMATCNTTLPVELLSFSGEAIDAKNSITWETATEINNEYFELQASEDGKTFNTIYKVEGAGNSSQKLNYGFLDFNPYTLTYYKLKQTDFDGTISTSKTISINRNDDNYGNINIYPSLVDKDFINVDFTSETNQTINLNIQNMLGQEVVSLQKEIFIGKNRLNLNFEISNGFYFVNIDYENKKYTQKIIVKK